MTVGNHTNPGRTSDITDEEIRHLMDQGLSASAIARHFTERGRRRTAQAMALRVRKLRDQAAERANYILPWRIQDAHGSGWVYKSALAYAKQRAGRGVTPDELKMSRELEYMLSERDAVLTYDYNQGFQIRDRRPDDGPGVLAKV
jgi:hypothetical protein